MILTSNWIKWFVWRLLHFIIQHIFFNINWNCLVITLYTLEEAWNVQFQIELRVESDAPCLLFPFPRPSKKRKMNKQETDILVQYENLVTQKAFSKKETGTRRGANFVTSITVFSKGIINECLLTYYSIVKHFLLQIKLHADKAIWLRNYVTLTHYTPFVEYSTLFYLNMLLF